MYSWNDLKDFWEYLEFYPYPDDPEYDGVHPGGIKGIAADAPDVAKEAFEKYQKMEKEAKKKNVKY